jgi:hypothetical protein
MAFNAANLSLFDTVSGNAYVWKYTTTVDNFATVATAPYFPVAQIRGGDIVEVTATDHTRSCVATGDDGTLQWETEGTFR